MTSFSETFCEAFPPCRLHHQRTVSNVNYRGMAWTPDQKDIILAELENREVTQHAIATYLHVSDNRINKLNSSWILDKVEISVFFMI